MSQFGAASLRKLDTCHADIRAVCFEVVPIYDHIIICGARSQAEQDEAYAKGLSGKKGKPGIGVAKAHKLLLLQVIT